MKKEISKMYGYAIGKIVFSVALAVVAYGVIFCSDAEIEEFGKIVCTIGWGIACGVYFISGVRTMINGTRQVKTYMTNTVYNESRLEEECESATDYGRIRVGEKHVFANASNGFFVIPYKEIETAFTRSHKYTYAYIKAKCLPKRIKMYYLNRRKAGEAVQSILWKTKQVSDAENETSF